MVKSKKKVLLFGGSGLLGSSIRRILSSRFHIISPTRSEVDLLNTSAVQKSIETILPDAIVNAAGETNPDNAEREKEKTLKLNYEATTWMASFSSFLKIPIIYFSTNAVFRGNQSSRPYRETDPVDPVNYYGMTKAKGEEAVLDASTSNCVIRLNLLYTSAHERKLDFARRTLQQLSSNNEVTGIIDHYCNPTYSDDAVHVLATILEKKINGIIHVGAIDPITNYNFIGLLCKEFGFDKTRIKPITLEMFTRNKKAQREHFSWLDISQTRKVLGRNILHTNKHNIARFHHSISPKYKL